MQLLCRQKGIKIYNLSLESKFEQFEKITYEEFEKLIVLKFRCII